jgi:hypothetical protein
MQLCYKSSRDVNCEMSDRVGVIVGEEEGSRGKKRGWRVFGPILGPRLVG